MMAKAIPSKGTEERLAGSEKKNQGQNIKYD